MQGGNFGGLGNRFYERSSGNAKNLAIAGLKSRSQKLLDGIWDDPCQNPPLYQKLAGELAQAECRWQSLIVSSHLSVAISFLLKVEKRANMIAKYLAPDK